MGGHVTVEMGGRNLEPMGGKKKKADSGQPVEGETGTDSTGITVDQDSVRESATELAAKHGAKSGNSTPEQREKWKQEKRELRQKKLAEAGYIPTSKGSASSHVASPSLDNPPIDPAIVQRSLDSVVSGLNGFVVRKIFRKVVRITTNKNTPKGDLEIAKGFAEDIDLGSEGKKAIVEPATLVWLKYRFLAENAPEAALALALLGYGGQIAHVLSRLNELEAQVASYKPQPNETAP